MQERNHVVGAAYVRTNDARLCLDFPRRPIHLYANGASHHLAIQENASKMLIEERRNLVEMYQAQFEAGMITLEQLQSLTGRV